MTRAANFLWKKGSGLGLVLVLPFFAGFNYFYFLNEATNPRNG
jgi:hypothetical protein